jgi:uncharacterized protein
MAEQDLAILLRTMEPVLHPEPYGYGVWAGGVMLIEPFATVSEDEGLTIVAPLAELRAAGMRSEPWARISLTVHSDLVAVGLTAAFASALGAEGISCNVVAGYHHDHLFVQWDRRGDAMAALRRLSIA